MCGFLTWLWVFYRAKHDLPVVLGWRHPWEHAADPWAIHHHEGEQHHALEEGWDEFAVKSTMPGEADDDDDDDDEEEEEGNGDDDDEDDEE